MSGDFIVVDQAIVWMFQPLTDAARRFVQDKVTGEDIFRRDLSFFVDHRMAEAIFEDLEAEGFSLITRH
jgi:hypothetical protein